MNPAVYVLILPVVQAIKLVGIPDSFAPLVSLVVGMLLGLLGYASSGDAFTAQAFWNSILQGLVAGLAASGLYSGMRAMSEDTPPPVGKRVLVRPPQN